ncbi:MAG: hypothetical protein K2M64_01235 [Clostridia bacterium]|nr:hypothetical protein [Clostridia bacterium]
MKKSTVLILLIVFVGSVLVVGIFGMQSVPYEQIVYVKQIVPTSVTTMIGSSQNVKIQINEEGYYIMLPYEEGLELLINYDLKPVDCTNKNIKVTIIYPTTNPPAQLTERNTIVFTKKGSVCLRYQATDSVTGPHIDFWIHTY